MKIQSLRSFFLLLLSALLFATAACAAPAPTPGERLTGIWEEYQPNSNVVQFFPDHTIRLYLTREEGAASNAHWIGGSWKVTPQSVLVLDLKANGRSLHQEVKVVFDGEEMVLVSDTQTETRHRRLNGPIPEKYRW